jgi:hypothetical protein
MRNCPPSTIGQGEEVHDREVHADEPEEEHEPDHATVGDDRADVGDADRALDVLDLERALGEPQERDVDAGHHPVCLGDAEHHRVEGPVCPKHDRLGLDERPRERELPAQCAEAVEGGAVQRPINERDAVRPRGRVRVGEPDLHRRGLGV